MKFPAFVVSGRGMASKLRRDDVTHLSQNLGITLVPGSMNLVCHQPVWLNTTKSIYRNEQGHFYWNAQLNGYPVLVSRWSGSCPVHVLEVYSEEHLRSRFALNDGDAVSIEIPDETVDLDATRSILNRVIWNLVWRGREALAYRDGRYLKAIGHWRVHRCLGRIYHNPRRIL